MQLRWWQYVLVVIMTAVIVMLALDASSPMGWIENYRNRAILRSMRENGAEEMQRDATREERRRVRDEERGTVPPP